MCILLIWSYPVNKKKLFLKLAVPKKQAKSLEKFLRETSFLLHLQAVGLKFHKKTTLSQAFPLHLAKLTYQLFACGIVKNLIIEVWIFLSSSVYYSSPFMFSNFRSTFFLGTPSSGCFSLYRSNVTPKKIK